jgi:negative regulator of flagellin synthesis FlgM
MNMSSSLEGLRSLLGVNATGPAATPAENPVRSNAPATEGGSTFNDLATLSSAGSQVSATASGDGVRMDKVAAIQSALAAGTYNVPASAVASKVMDSMMGGR